MSTSRAAGDRPDSRTLDYRQAGPTAVRMLVGAQLRRLREAHGLSRDTAGEAIGASASKISRLERGQSGFKQHDVAKLLTLYDVHADADRQALLGLVRQDSMPEWWKDYTDVVPSRFEPFLGLELAAHVIRSYETEFIPGLLQTEDYARAVIRLSHHDDTEEQIQRRVSLRMHRQRILERVDQPHLWAVIDENALRRPVGGTEIQRAQLLRLIEVIQRQHVTVQVVPLHISGQVAAGGPITILRFPEAHLPDVVYLENLISALYLDKPTDVSHYWDVMNRVGVQAAPAAETKGILHRVLDEI